MEFGVNTKYVLWLPKATQIGQRFNAFFKNIP